MFTTVTDTQTVPSTASSLLFTILQQGAVSVLVTLKNSGANTTNYRFQEMISGTWTDIGSSGSDTYNTLTAGEVKVFKLSSSYSQVRLVGNASGGSSLDFSLARYHARSDAGPVPILNL